MRAFVIVVTQEKRLRFRMMTKEHGLLHDRAEKKSYAIIREAYATNWLGKYARAYLVFETIAQTIELDGSAYTIHGGTADIREPLNMVAKVRMPGLRGEDGGVREVHLTAESIYDRTLAVQVRKLGNRRFQWFHALAFAAVGAFIMAGFMTTIAIFGSHPVAPPSSPPIVVTPGSAPAAPQSGPAGGATILVPTHAAPGNNGGGGG